MIVVDNKKEWDALRTIASFNTKIKTCEHCKIKDLPCDCYQLRKAINDLSSQIRFMGRPEE